MCTCMDADYLPRGGFRRRHLPHLVGSDSGGIGRRDNPGTEKGIENLGLCTCGCGKIGCDVMGGHVRMARGWHAMHARTHTTGWMGG